MRRRITKSVVDKTKPGERDLFIWDTEVSGFGCKITPTGRKVYLLQYRNRVDDWKTAPHRITLGKHGPMSAEQARQLATTLLLEAKKGKDPAEKWRRGGHHNVAELTERFLTGYLPSKKKPPTASTIRGYESLIRCHIVPKLGKKRVDEVKRADIERLHQNLRKTPYTANRMLSVLQQSFNQAEAWGWRKQHTNPIVHIDRYPEESRGAKKDVMLTPHQMGALLQAVDEHETKGGDPYSCAAIRFTFWTGWRISEVLGLECGNVSFETGLAKLLRTKAAAEEYRQVPSEALRVLGGLERITGCPYIFPGTGSTGHLTTIKKTWKQIRKAAGLDDLDGLGALRLHDLRHNVVSWDVSRGASLEMAGKNVGHRSRQATEIYAHFAPNALKRAANERASVMLEAIKKRTLK